MLRGPIGARLTIAVARIVMHDWAVKYQKILEEVGMVVRLFVSYVEDGCQATTILPKRHRFDKEVGVGGHLQVSFI